MHATMTLDALRDECKAAAKIARECPVCRVNRWRVRMEDSGVSWVPEMANTTRLYVALACRKCGGENAVSIAI